MSTAKKFAGQTAVYGLTTVAGRTLNFFLTSLYTRAYSPSVYGIFGNMFSWASIFNALLAFGMETTYFRYLNKHSDSKQKVYNNSFGAIFIITVLFLLVTLPLVKPITAWIRIDRHTSMADYVNYTRFFIGILVIDAWCVIPFAKLRAEGRPGRYGMLKLVNIFIFIGLNLLFIVGLPYIINHQLPGAGFLLANFRPGWLGYVFLSNLIASFVTFLMLLPELLKLRPVLDKPMLSEMLKYSWPVLIANFSFIINETSDKLLLGKLLPESISSGQVGIYTACAKIAIFLNLFVQAFRLGAEPFFFSQAKNKNATGTYAQIMNYFIIAVALIFVGLMANIELLKYFVGKSYWSGLNVVPLLLLGYVCLGIYMNLSIWYKLSDQTKYGLYISSVGAVLTIVINVVFIPKYSYMASAWASLTAYASMMIMSYIWGQKNYPIPYNLKKNLTYIISSVIIVFLSFSVFHRSLLIGNGLLVLFAGAAFMAERKQIMAILKK
ncbi:lipopolysaccharide biosynthesis protein [Mucilaginibacter galii]|uniref:Polysaccharide biosynthesis protein n=1 Tax=Mucilaginibacter galii TaxID=2005073 RepID=A0A917JB07_9SPHI|nr:polysaccharide biosynthesis C-terminal domain-containing protein [Mucilaginibacter galii]GGI51804.1 polysaccharide biosynthesis protein [Mucilaginibacter galii]